MPQEHGFVPGAAAPPAAGAQRKMTEGTAQLVGGVKVGDLLAGKYRVERALGAGGMGVVVAAHDEPLDRKVALKFLLPEVLGNAEAVGRFRREAQAAVKIKSEHVAAVYEVGTLDNGAPFIVMEYLEGGDLSGWLEQKGVLPIEQAIEFILQACEAIAEAHGLGIVHRDLKPANLFQVRRADGILAIKVLDFGISKLTGAPALTTGDAITRTSMVMGSPQYMSPEQLRSARDVDARTDIWALGVILYQLLTGQPPFDSESVADLFVRIMVNPTPSVRAKRPDVPEGIEQAINKCLQKDREQRYANVADFAGDLAPYAPRRARASVERIRRIIQNYGLGTAVMSLPPSIAPQVAAPAAQTDVAWGQSAHPKPSRKNKLVWGGALFGVAALGSALLWWQNAQPRERSATTAAMAVPSQSMTPPALSGTATVAANVVANASVDNAARPDDAGVVAVALKPSASSASDPKPDTATSLAGQKGRGLSAAHARSAKEREPSVVTTPKLNEAPSPRAPNCDPNYTLDAEGRKLFKPECFK